MNVGSYHSTWVEVNLEAIQDNIRFVHQHSGVHVMAVVKANGYGHGAVPVAQAALHGGATWCGVARIEEALELRQAGLGSPILLLGWTPFERMEEALAGKISMTVWDYEQIDRAATLAKRSSSKARLHLKVDTGMGRLGVQPEKALELARHMAGRPEIIFEGLFTHFARADLGDQTTTKVQEARFRKALAQLESFGLRPPLIHTANSAAILTRPSAHFDMVRLGIAMYGLHPSSECPTPGNFHPALGWKAILSNVKVLPPGHGVSYGHEYVTQAHERIGTIPVGYADGIRRLAGNNVLVGGQRAPVVGRVCMDQIMVQLDHVPQACNGDEVVLIGSQGSERITAEEIAQLWGTINYEVVCGIGPRVPRLYLN